MNKCRILSTKKLSGPFHTALSSSVELVEMEFISIQPIARSAIQQQVSELHLNSKKITVVFTSRHAVIDAGELFLLNYQQVPECKVYCLAGATLEAVHKKLSRPDIVGSANSAQELAEKIISDSVPELIFFCGNKRREVLPALLKKNGIQTHEIVVYETQYRPIKVQENFDAILFFSPSAVESFFMANNLPGNVTCFAIGETTTGSIRDHTSNEVITCEHPTKNCMIDAIEIFLSKQKMNDDVEK